MYFMQTARKLGKWQNSENSSKYFATLDYNSINPNFIFFKEYFHSSNIQELKKKIDKSF